ncbi:XdhC/CoxI family protein [Streptomyces sp. NPDC050610]|uniref:XdhC/CoxI family protein n=1 Tax=Streptomyces sp. NPDC050610 TaxID=3157097 RepID=UPI003431C4F6
MLDIAAELRQWCDQGRDFAVATVVATHGSAPRQPGAALAVDADGTAIGSVSGGCVEGAVYELCRESLKSGESLLERFGFSDEDAFAVGLTCGGVIDILITPVRAGSADARTLAAALSAAARGEAAALARVVRRADGSAAPLGRPLLVRPDGTYEGALGGPAELDRTVAAEARAMLDAGRTGTLTVGTEAVAAPLGAEGTDPAPSDSEADATAEQCGERVVLLVESSAPPPRMIVFGAIDFAAALVKVGKLLGYHVTVCDARPVFATPRRFPEADEIVVDWPHRYLDTQRLDGRGVLCVLTHDAKFDVPLLERALRLPVAYVGAMGSRRTHLDRLARLRDAGLTEPELARLHSPIGLDLGARTPEETALSIAGEIVAARRGGTGAPLTGAHTPIHHDVRTPLGRIGSVA